MAVTDDASIDDQRSPAPDDVEDVAWDLEPLVEGKGAAGVDELIDRAETLVPSMLEHRGRVAEIDAGTLVRLMQTMADLQELIGRAASYAGLRFAVDTSDPANGALMQRVQERATTITTQLIWFELEWAALDDAAADAVARRRTAGALPVPPRVGAPIPTSPAHRAGREDRHREGRHRALGMGAPLQRADGRDQGHAPRRHACCRSSVGCR